MTATEVVGLVLLVPVLLVASPSSAETPDQLLHMLGTSLMSFRAMSGEQYAALEPVPDGAMLRGIARELLLSSFGKPDNCEPFNGPSVHGAECEPSDTWSYWFFYLPRGSRGGGPELWLRFDDHNLVEEVCNPLTNRTRRR